MWLPALFAALSLLPAAAGNNEVSARPNPVPQGDVIRVYASIQQAASARLNGVTSKLFPQADGPAFGLMPVGVLQRPGVFPLEWLDAQGRIVQSEPLRVLNAHYGRQNVVLSKSLTELKSTTDERATVSAFLQEVTAERQWREPLEPPIPGCITSPFGVSRLHNGKPTGDYHAGLDQRGAFGSPIHAVAGGTVKIVRQFSLRGSTVAIDHGQGLESIYLHMSRFAAVEGQQVKQGDVIGYVGSSGRSTGPHLHWTLYVYGQPVNPLQWVHLESCTAAAASPGRRAKRPGA